MKKVKGNNHGSTTDMVAFIDLGHEQDSTVNNTQPHKRRAPRGSNAKRGERVAGGRAAGDTSNVQSRPGEALLSNRATGSVGASCGVSESSTTRGNGDAQGRGHGRRKPAADPTVSTVAAHDDVAVEGRRQTWKIEAGTFPVCEETGEAGGVARVLRASVHISVVDGRAEVGRDSADGTGGTENGEDIPK